jgi:hypothetical protein
MEISNTFYALGASSLSIFLCNDAVDPKKKNKQASNFELTIRSIEAVVYPIFQILPTYTALKFFESSSPIIFLLTKIAPVFAYLGKSTAIFIQDPHAEACGLVTDGFNVFLSVVEAIVILSYEGPIAVALSLISIGFACAHYTNVSKHTN